MGMVVQKVALWDSMTVGENIELALHIRKHLPEDARREIISESLCLVGLDDVENKFPGEFSGGMMKRAATSFFFNPENRNLGSRTFWTACKLWYWCNLYDGEEILPQKKRPESTLLPELGGVTGNVELTRPRLLAKMSLAQ